MRFVRDSEKVGKHCLRWMEWTSRKDSADLYLKNRNNQLFTRVFFFKYINYRILRLKKFTISEKKLNARYDNDEKKCGSEERCKTYSGRSEKGMKPFLGKLRNIKKKVS